MKQHLLRSVDCGHVLMNHTEVGADDAFRLLDQLGPLQIIRLFGNDHGASLCWLDQIS